MDLLMVPETETVLLTDGFGLKQCCRGLMIPAWSVLQRAKHPCLKQSAEGAEKYWLSLLEMSG